MAEVPLDVETARPWVVTSANARVQELDHPAADVPDELRPSEMKDCRVRLAHVEDAGVLAELIAAFSGDQGDAARCCAAHAGVCHN